MSASGKTAGQMVGAASRAVSELSNTEVSWELGTSSISRAIGTTGPAIQVEVSGQSVYELKECDDDIFI